MSTVKPAVCRCTIEGEHLSTCIGIKHARGKAVACEGCLPQPADRGLLCFSCTAKVDELWEVLFDIITHTRSIERGPADNIPVRSAPGSRVILPPSWQAADETWSTMHALIVRAATAHGVDAPAWHGGTTWRGFGVTDSIDVVMANVWEAVFWLLQRVDLLHEERDVARRLLRLVRVVQGALQAFPLQERAHLVQHVTCRDCQQVTLRWEPPLNYREPIVVRCMDTKCGGVFDPAQVEVDMRQLREQLEHYLKVVACAAPATH